MATPDYLASLINTESGGNWADQNNVMGAGGMAGHFGRVQFGKARLQDAMNAGAIPFGTTPEQFMASPELQMAAEKWHFADLESQLAPYVGAVVNGKPLDMAALVAMGHLGGAGGAKKYVETGGAYNPSDAYGTSLSDYASTHGGAGGGGLVASTKGGAPVNGLLGVPPEQDASGLIGLLTGEAKPWAGKLNDIGAVLLALSGSPAAQPLMEQLNKRKDAKREDARLNQTAAWLASMGRDDLASAVMAGGLSGSDAAAIAMTPAEAEVIPAGFRELELQAQAAGLQPGTPEYQQFMLSGGAAMNGEGPAAFQALHMQALAAGFEEGSPEYQEFMATRGAGLVAESKAMGEAAGSAAAAAPAEVAAADETLGFIDEVRNHPGIDAGTGLSSMGNIIPGTSGYDFQNRVNQLLSGGFLTAIEQLRGTGALSNAEGQTATRAISRMDTATSKEEFLAALADYERVVKEGRDRASKRIPAPVDGTAPASGAGTVIDGYTIEAMP